MAAHAFITRRAALRTLGLSAGVAVPTIPLISDEPPPAPQRFIRAGLYFLGGEHDGWRWCEIGADGHFVALKSAADGFEFGRVDFGEFDHVASKLYLGEV